ncbi:MAG TPA: polysaccharide deacetylase family protein, partial [Acidimicrobiales bacterium]|nr:polysaccharide deacetylase family protein [Acidimicrobiales bacterium]
ASGIHITFSPNGAYQALWNPRAETLKPLIEAGQVQIANHTFSHHDMTRSSDSSVVADIERNDEWVQKSFGITTRPYLRPPYGNYDARTNEIAGSLGYTSILMWNGTFGDSSPITTSQIIDLANRWMRPGAIMLGHANYPTIEGIYSNIESIIATRGLRTVTLDEMFKTSRNSA